MDIAILIIMGAMFFGPPVVALALPGESWKRRAAWAGATFIPVLLVVTVGALLGIVHPHHEYFVFALLFVGIFGGWAVLWRYVKRQERDAS